MSPSMQTAASSAQFHPPVCGVPSVLTPLGIRVNAARLVHQNRLDEADTLTLAGVVRFPYSEETLVVRALVAEVRQEWDLASLALHSLLSLQGAGSPPETWRHWIRVLRCQGEFDLARQATAEALERHPGHEGLMQEAEELGVPTDAEVPAAARRRAA